MKIPESARYSYCYRMACEFLDRYHIDTYPIDPFEIIRKESLTLIKYSELANENKLDVEAICRLIKSNDAYTINYGTTYIIAYNDTKDDRRIRFTLMHEIGHIFLGHLNDFEETAILCHDVLQSNLELSKYKVLENEANVFARNVLVPVSMALRLSDCSKNSVSHIFGITRTAAAVRLSLLSTDLYYYSSLGLRKNINTVFFKFYYKKTCLTCGYGNLQKSTICIICGSKMIWGKGDNMKYPLIDSNADGKLLSCPVCKNDNTDNIVGEYCQICGTRLVNRCLNSYCDNRGILPTNARFCPVCAEKTPFFNNGILKAWNAEEDYIPFGSPPDEDDELPFN